MIDIIANILMVSLLVYFLAVVAKEKNRIDKEMLDMKAEIGELKEETPYYNSDYYHEKNKNYLHRSVDDAYRRADSENFTAGGD